jgi:hypothetical protein
LGGSRHLGNNRRESVYELVDRHPILDASHRLPLPSNCASDDPKHEVTVGQLNQSVLLLSLEESDEFITAVVVPILANESTAVFDPLAGLYLPEGNRLSSANTPGCRSLVCPT